MTVDLTKFSDADIDALSKGDMKALSDDGLNRLLPPAQPTQPAQPDALHKYLITPTEDLGQGALDYIVHGTTAPHGLLHGLAALLPGDGGETAALNKALGQNRPDLSLSGVAGSGISALHDALKNVAVPTRPQDVMTKVGEFIPGVAATIAAPEAEAPALARGAITGAMGGALAPGQDPLSLRNLAESAGLGGALGQAGNLGRGLLSRLTGADVGKTAGELNPEVMQGTRQPLQTPFMRGLAKVQGAAPFSGDRSFKQSLFDKVQDLDSQLKDNPQASGTEPNQQAYDDYQSQYEDAKNNTNDKYSILREKLDKNNISVEPKELIPAVKDIASKIDSINAPGPEVQKKIVFLQKRLKGLNTRQSAYGGHQPPLTFEEGKDIDTATNVNPMTMSPTDRAYMAKIKNAVNNDLEASSEGKSQPEILQAFKNAKQARVDQGMFEKNIHGKPSEFAKQYNNPRANTELAPPRFIQNMIRPSTGNVDNTAFSKHLTDNLPEETKQDIFNALMKPKEDMSLAQQLNKIGNYKDSQLQQLIGDKTGLLNQMKQLKSLSPEAMSPEFVPQTGLTGAKAALTGGAGGFGLHDPMAGLGMAGMAIGNRALNHLLRSEAFKNAAIKSLARRGTQNALSKYVPRITGAITGSTGDNNNGR